MSVNDQTEFWAGEFGKAYIERNRSELLHAANLAFFAELISRMGNRPATAIEFGANIGMNYLALKALSPGLEFTGVEVNEAAALELKMSGAKSINISLEEFETNQTFDLSFTKGVLIHLNPSSLTMAYRKLASASNKYVLIAEYFNPVPVAITYRGFSDRLFKRDFGGEFLESQPGFELTATGFLSSRGPFPQDDLTWWLFRKVN